MRQGQQNRRGRGRSRKPQNPLARNFESNGPDVKIRGTASHVAEKYMSLARDALASGDIVMAESYLQHAEHYNRIIMAAQTPSQPGAPQGDAPNGGSRPQSRWHSDSDEEDSESEESEAAAGQSGGGQSGGGQGSGSQDRERHEGNREHHGGGRGRGRQGGNGADTVRDANGAEPAEATASDESEKAPDQVS